MTPRLSPALVTIARIASVVSLLAGCASAPREADRPLSPPLSPTFTSLRISDTELSADAIQTAEAGKGIDTPRSASPALPDEILPVVEVSVPQPLAQAIDLTCNVDDIFQRMRNGFSMPDINNHLVLYHQQWYLNRPDYLRRIVERSSLYLHHIVEELDKRGMPMELALLPMVESAYNPMAFSRAKASGLWQFIPATGKRYKLDQNWWKDERRDIVASTAAALNYLQSIYEMHGDWHLALASYNWGEGAVGRALNKNRAHGLPTDYLSLTMPGETKNYVPKLQALKNIFSNPALLAELNLTNIPNRPYFGTVTKTVNIDVKVAARLAGMPVHDFVALNPSHNRPVIKSETPLVIPADKLDTFVNNLEAHEVSNKPLSAWQSYTLRPGDKLEMIAPRFGMTVAHLKAVNGIKGRLKVSPGFTLLVAGKGGGEPLDMAALPEQPRLPDADPVAKTGRSHSVRRGETLPALAKRYGTTVAELKRINHLRSDRITPGTRLAVSPAGKTLAKRETTPVPVTVVKADSPAVQQARQEKQAPRITHYTIRLGDTLASIARQFKVAANDLMRWNNVSPKTLQPGKTLTIQLAKNP